MASSCGFIGARRSILRMLGVVCCLAVSTDATPACAHAHVFILDTVEAVFTAKELTGLRLRWTFDEVFSDGMFNDFDANGNRTFDPPEVDAIREVTLPSMKEFGYFTHLWLNGTLEQDFADVFLDVTSVGDTVIYEWTITLAQPADPSRDKVEVSIFDDSYFVDVALHFPDAVKLHNAPSSCRYEITEDETKAYYYDSIYPQVIRLSC